jgi:intracellular multiplication protein IcmC
MKKMKKNQLRWCVGVLLFAMVSPAFAFDSTHYMSSLNEILIIIQDVCIGLGLGLFLGGIFKLKRYGESRTFMSQQLTIGKPLGMIFSAVCLLTIKVALGTISQTLWGDSSPLAYPDQSDMAGKILKPLIATVRVLGVIGVIRGIILFSRAGGEQSQPGTVGKAFMHIIGGLLCMHVINVYNILNDILTF